MWVESQGHSLPFWCQLGFCLVPNCHTWCSIQLMQWYPKGGNHDWFIHSWEIYSSYLCCWFIFGYFWKQIFLEAPHWCSCLPLHAIAFVRKLLTRKMTKRFMVLCWGRQATSLRLDWKSYSRKLVVLVALTLCGNEITYKILHGQPCS